MSWINLIHHDRATKMNCSKLCCNIYYLQAILDPKPFQLYNEHYTTSNTDFLLSPPQQSMRPFFILTKCSPAQTKI